MEERFVANKPPLFKWIIRLLEGAYDRLFWIHSYRCMGYGGKRRLHTMQWPVEQDPQKSVDRVAKAQIFAKFQGQEHDVVCYFRRRVHKGTRL